MRSREDASSTRRVRTVRFRLRVRRCWMALARASPAVMAFTRRELRSACMALVLARMLARSALLALLILFTTPVSWAIWRLARLKLAATTLVREENLVWNWALARLRALRD